MVDDAGEGSAAAQEKGGDEPRLTVAKIRYRLWSLVDALGGADNDPKMYEFEKPPDDGETDDGVIIDRLNDRSDAFVRERAGLRAWRALLVILTAGIPLVFILWVVRWDDPWDLGNWHWRFGSCLIFLEFFLPILLLFVRARVAS